MQTIAAIDVGSNAVRLVVGRIGYAEKLETLDNIRLPVRLGEDVFSHGHIGEQTAQQLLDAFVHFRKVAQDYGVQHIRAVATSALREAKNSDILRDRIARRTGIDIQIIRWEEEARLIHLAVATAVNLKGKNALLIDIGGGSVEVTISRGRNILSTESYNMGTVRLLQKLARKPSRVSFAELVSEYAAAIKRRIHSEIGGDKIELCIGTGGNIEEMGVLRKKLFHRESDDAITLPELEKLIRVLSAMTVNERMRKLKLKPDRADVILPACIVLRVIAQEAHVKEIKIPHVGLKDGILLDLAGSLSKIHQPVPREQVWTSALRLGEKYQFDAEHGKSVAHLAGSLFDQAQPLHGLDSEHKLLLEVAALLHDIGYFISALNHERHGYYILQANPLIGLTEREQAIVANLVRYHRKSMPTAQDENLRVLNSADRLLVIKLAGLLRLADAMDVTHTGRVRRVDVRLSRRKCCLRLQGESGLSLEHWALGKRRSMFQDVFGLRLEIEA